MAMGPLDASRPWETRDVVGMYRFLQRLWRYRRRRGDRRGGRHRRRARRRDEQAAAPHDRRRAHRDGRAAVQHRDRQADRAQQPRHQARRHPARGRRADGDDGRAAGTAHRRGAVGASSATTTRSPTSRSPTPTRRCSSTTPIELPVQVNGKVRGRVIVAADADAEPRSKPLRSADDKVAASLDGATPKKVIVVPGRMVNIVV